MNKNQHTALQKSENENKGTINNTIKTSHASTTKNNITEAMTNKELYGVNSITIEVLERLLGATHKECSCAEKAHEEKDYELCSAQVYMIKLEEELENEHIIGSIADSYEEGTSAFSEEENKDKDFAEDEEIDWKEVK